MFVGHWEVHAPDAEIGDPQESFLIIRGNLKGEFAFGHRKGEVDARVRAVGGVTFLEWSWEDLDSGDCGRGYARLEASALLGSLFTHDDEEVEFAAIRREPLPAASASRPYLKCRIEELEALEQANQNDVITLEAILTELEFRAGKQRNAALRSRVEARLDELHEEAEAEEPYDETDGEPGEGGLLADWPQVGLLAHVGYRVGRAGVPESERRRLLDFVYKAHDLPQVNDEDYMDEWGAPMSSDRLKKLAESLAAFCRNQRRLDARLGRQSLAAAHWEADVVYLKHAYYRDHFEWPRTDVVKQTPTHPEDR